MFVDDGNEGEVDQTDLMEYEQEVEASNTNHHHRTVTTSIDTSRPMTTATLTNDDKYGGWTESYNDSNVNITSSSAAWGAAPTTTTTTRASDRISNNNNGAARRPHSANMPPQKQVRRLLYCSYLI
jgi:hypothetical protein